MGGQFHSAMFKYIRMYILVGVCYVCAQHLCTCMTAPSVQFVHCGMVAILHWLQGAKNVHLSVMWTSKANCVSSAYPLGLPVLA